MSAPEPQGYWDQYLWMVVTGGLASCFMAWGIGANDVANSFATSVGSKTLKLWQAVIVAGVFEFLGAVVLGGVTTKTVASKIANVSLYDQFPEIYMYGMLCSLTIAGSWLLLATYWGFAVSTTHSITGSIMGFALVYGGFNDGVIWHQEKGDFPYTSGFLPIVLSWFFSPIIAGILSTIIFNLARTCILRRQNSTNLAIYCIPILVFITFFINLMFVLAKGAKSDMQKRWPCVKSTGYKGLPIKDCSASYNAAAWIAAATAGGLAVISAIVCIPLLLRRVRREAEAAQNAQIEAPVDASAPDAEKIAAMEGGVSGSDSDTTPKMQRYKSIKVHEVPEDAKLASLPGHHAKRVWTGITRQFVKGMFYDVHLGVTHNAQVAAMHAGAEVFKPETERIFELLQVLSACCVAFAHGANDVANSIGPFSAIYTVYKTWEVPGSSSTTPKWIFVMGGLMIVVGLGTYGYNIIMTIGVQMLKLTPSRGFSAELAAGLTISLASFYGIPVSTTQIIVGAETGVGLSENLRTGVNFWLLLKTFMGWIYTIVAAALFCAALFSAGAYAPSILMAQDISDYNLAMFNIADDIYTGMETLNNAQAGNNGWWTGTNISPYNGSQLAVVINQQNTSYANALGLNQETRNAVYLNQALYYLDEAFSLEDSYSQSTIGSVP